MKIGTQKILLLLAVVFFVVYAWPTVGVTWPEMKSHAGHYISSWPDGMANYFFASKLAKDNSLNYSEPLNSIASDTVQPRSVNVFKHNIVPTGFLGFILILGVLGKILGFYALMLVTPLVAVLAVLAFYGIVKRLYGERIAWLAALLLFVLPPFWYYASLPMLPNILFLSLAISAYYFYFKQTDIPKYYYSLISGLLFGLAIIIRPMEIVWLIALALIPILVYREHFKLKRAVWLVVGVLVPIIILLAVNQQLYGNAWYTGYLYLNEDKGSGVINRLPPALVTNLSASLAYPKLILAPFGIHPRLILHNLNSYWLKLLWPWCLLFVGSLFLNWRQFKLKRLSRPQKVYWLVYLTVGILLVTYYGSWLFDDKLTLRLNTIGISYTRYWLPLYILMLPAIAFGLEQASLIFKQTKTKMISLVIVCLLLLSWSYSLVYLKSGDGLRDQAQVTRNNYQLLDEIKTKVNKEAVIICDREDKILWPEYSVVVFNGNEAIWPAVKNIIGKRPIYYLSRASDAEISALNERLQGFKMTLAKTSKVNDQFTLYSLGNN